MGTFINFSSNMFIRFLLCSRRGKWVILGPKIYILDFSLNLCNRFFWIFTRWQALKSWLFFIFKKKFYYAQTGLYGSSVIWGDIVLLCGELLCICFYRFGMRYVAMTLKQALKDKFPNAKEDDILKV